MAKVDLAGPCKRRGDVCGRIVVLCLHLWVLRSLSACCDTFRSKLSPGKMTRYCSQQGAPSSCQATSRQR